MAIKFASVPLPKTARTVTSKYDFAALTIGGPAMVETEVVNVDKVHSKLTSALVAYRARTDDKSKFSVRSFKQEDGTDAVGVWKVAEAAAEAPAEAPADAPAEAPAEAPADAPAEAPAEAPADAPAAE